MRIIVAPNAFKGSLTALEAARALRAGVERCYPQARVVELPIADGGDGLIDALRGALGGVLVAATVHGPNGERRRAAYLWIPQQKLAVVEMARASGLALVPQGKRKPLTATSRGTGDLMRDAVRRGARTIVVGMGGSASNDGGAGMASALGVRLLDGDGRELADGAAPLLRLASIDARTSRRLLSGVKVIALSDVTNPLLGPRGSARVYGPQKGATPAMVRTIDAALTRYAAIVKRDLGVSVAAVPGSGAAGGLGAGLLAFTSAKIAPGADWVLARVGAERALARAELAVTGEGKLDRTSLFGKAPVAFARLARRRGVPCVAVGGQVEARIRLPFRRVVSFRQAGARSTADSLRRARLWAAKAAAHAVAGLLTLALVAAPARAGADALKQADALYFQRDKVGKLEEALTVIDQSLAGARGSDAAELLWRRCRALVRRGEKKEVKKDKLADFEAARLDGEKALKLNPNIAEAHFWHGVAMGRYGETKGILKSLFIIGPFRAEMRETLRLDPSYGGAHVALGEMLWQIPGFAGGDKRQAMAEYETAVRLSPNFSANYPPLAKAYVHFGRRDDACALLLKLWTIKQPADPPDYKDDVEETTKIVKTVCSGTVPSRAD